MYTASAEYYDALYHFKDFAGEASLVRELVLKHNPRAQTLLDVACGTGQHLAALREHFEVEGLDIDPTLIAQAAERCPGVRFTLGDMVEFDLDRTFDAVVCLFSAVAYSATLPRMRSAVASMARHLAPGGLLLLGPWFTPERFDDGRLVLNVAERPGRKIAWMYVQRAEGPMSILDIHYLIGEANGSVRHLEERHTLGLFTHDEYVAAMRDCGMRVTHDPQWCDGRGLYIAMRA